MNSLTGRARLLLIVGIVAAVLTVAIVVAFAVAGVPPLGLVLYAFLPALVAVACLIGVGLIRAGR